MDPRAWRLAGALILGLTSGACSSPGLYLAPTIRDAELRDGDELQARVAVAWRGVAEHDGALELHFRCRIENPRSTPLPIAPAEFELLDGALATLGPARADDLPAAVEGGQAATFDLAFPVTKDLQSSDFDAVQVRASLEGGKWSWTSRFERIDPYPYGYPYYYGYPYSPFWGGPWAFHAGVVHCHH